MIPYEENEICEDCTLGDRNRHIGNSCNIQGHGSMENGILFVTDILTRNDTNMGGCLEGTSGSFFNDVIKKAGYDREDIYTTSLMKCTIPGVGQKPNKHQIASCGKKLEKEIEKLKPKLVVLMGALVVKYFFPDKKMSDIRGYIFDDNIVKILPTYGVNAILNRPTNLFEFQSDVKKAFEVIEGNITEMERKYIYTEDFETVYETLKKQDEYAWDIETTSLDEFKGDCISCSFSFKEGTAICIPFDEGWFRKIFALPAKTICHTKFDPLFLKARYGIDVNNWYFDTYAAIQLLNDNASQGLKSLASIFTDVPYYNLDSKEGLENIPIEVVAEYNNFDADVTYRLYKIFHQQIIDERYYKMFMEVTMPVNRMLIDIELQGIVLDINKVKTLTLERSLESLRVKRKLNEIAAINWNSTKQVGDVLFKQLGLRCPTKTPTGNLSTSEATLITLKDKHPAVEMLLELRHIVKGLGTYLLGIPEPDLKRPKSIPKAEEEKYIQWKFIKTELHLMHLLENLDEYSIDTKNDLYSLLQSDGKMHNHNNINGTVSGRLTSPLHTIPREGGYRECFTVPDDCLFVGMDYKQFELRIAANRANETKLIEILDSPGAKQILTKLITDLDYTEESWSQVKGVIYGVLYGRGSKSIAKEWNMSEDHAESLKRGFFDNFKKVKKLLNEYKSSALDKGYIIDMVGRKRRFLTKQYNSFDIDGDIVRAAVNFPIQAGSAAIFWPKVLEVHEFLSDKKSKVIHTKHDCVMFQIHKSEENLIEECKKILEENTLIGRVPVDVKIGKNWGDA